MANPEHLAILKQGVERWNEWREQHIGVRPDLGKADLRGARLDRANLAEADLHGTDLREANLDGTSLFRADLERARLSDARLSGADLSQSDLAGADLSDATLITANLSGGVDLSGAILSGVDLNRAVLTDAELIETDLQGASLIGADLSGASLREANLLEAELEGTNFSNADLWNADLDGARASRTIFSAVDLSETKGLETVRHDGPSCIGIDTIYASRGKIPEAFLRGCGVPDGFIAYIGSMVGRPIEYYSCFISYSTRDQEFADRLYADLQAKGVRCWFAPHDIKGGRKIHEQIDEAIRLHDRLLLILSEHSMSSEWVNTEIAKARKRETREAKRVLFPVRLVGFERLRD